MSSHNVPLSNSTAGLPIAKALAGLAALAVAMGIGRFAFTPVLPMMLQDTGLSIASGGLLASANYLGYLVGALSAMAINIRPERVIRFGLTMRSPELMNRLQKVGEYIRYQSALETRINEFVILIVSRQ